MDPDLELPTLKGFIQIQSSMELWGQFCDKVFTLKTTFRYFENVVLFASPISTGTANHSIGFFLEDEN
jgi:hypothetical protein